jgi:PTS system mannitol-specific IIC component
MESMKGKKSSVASALVGAGSGPIKTIVFACDAGMGSSAMGASVLRKKIQQAGFGDVKVTNAAISNLTDTFDLVVSHRDLTARATQKTGSAVHVSVDDFMSSPRYDEIVQRLKQANGGGSTPAPVAPAAEEPATGSADVLPVSSIVLNGTGDSATQAIEEAGALLVAAGAVEPSYVGAMHEREKSVSTYMGNGLAIPHGTNEAKTAIRRTGISFVRYPEPIDWNGKPAEFVVGIAGAGNDHMALLTRIAHVFLDKDRVAELRAATTAEEIQAVLNAGA